MLELVDHMNNEHNEKLRIEKKKFETKTQFKEWKETTRKETTSWFVKYRKKVGKNSTTNWFRCNRSGTYKSRGTGKRAMKQQGTSKIDRHCTAFIKVVTPNNNENITVEACLGHTGHSQKLGHLRILDKLRQDIAGKFAKGVKIESILDDIRNSACDGIFRDHLVDRKDIINFKHQLQFNSIQFSF